MPRRGLSPTLPETGHDVLNTGTTQHDIPNLLSQNSLAPISPVSHRISDPPPQLPISVPQTVAPTVNNHPQTPARLQDLNSSPSTRAPAENWLGSESVLSTWTNQTNVPSSRPRSDLRGIIGKLQLTHAQSYVHCPYHLQAYIESPNPHTQTASNIATGDDHLKSSVLT